jgi:fructose-1,6-bisphosphatase/inositol monophosphatase family enzyme
MRRAIDETLRQRGLDVTLGAEEEARLVGLVREVGRAEVMPRFRALAPGDVKRKSRDDDLVTEADTRAEAAIGRGVAELMPDAGLLGEEAASADPGVLRAAGARGRVVVVDPIDGTWNFANGVATFGMILAVMVDGVTVFGLLYDPVIDDWVLARRGGGAWYCRPGAAPARLEVSKTAEVGRMTGLAPLFLFPAERQAALATAALDFGRVHTLRCSCHEYRLLAGGRVDFVASASSNPWDHLAGALAVEEAGGVVELLEGGDYRPEVLTGRIVAANAPATLAAVRTRFRG